MRQLLPCLLLASVLLLRPTAAWAPVRGQGYYEREDFYEYLAVFEIAFDTVRREAFAQFSSERLVRAAITGMLASVDPRAAYLDGRTPALKGGAADRVGLVLSRRQGGLEVVAARDGSPAARAGIAAGDVLLAIGREPAALMSLPEVEARLQGRAGSIVRLRLERRGVGHPLTVAVTRAEFRLRTVRSRLLGDIGYVRLAGFEAGTPAALRAAVTELRERGGGRLIGLILDLRDNSGGQFEAAAAAAGEFLDGRLIAFIRGRKEAAKPLRAPAEDLAAGLPMAVLINGGTAAEAELVAAALKDSRRAIVVGTKSFGENEIERIIPLLAGGAVRLATARFLTPAGRDIAHKGIVPDIVAEPADLDGRVRRRASDPAAALAVAEGGDEPLMRAADILRAFAAERSERG